MSLKPTLKVKHAGIPIDTDDGAQIVVPPLTLGQVETLKDLLINHDKLAQELSKKDSPVLSDAVVVMRSKADIIHQAVKRNYPEATIEDVLEVMDMNNTNVMFLAAIGNSRATQTRNAQVGEG